MTNLLVLFREKKNKNGGAKNWEKNGLWWYKLIEDVWTELKTLHVPIPLIRLLRLEIERKIIPKARFANANKLLASARKFLISILCYNERGYS